jgi:hypothetical protein
MAAPLSTIRYRENSGGRAEIESKGQRNQRAIPGSLVFTRVDPQETTVAVTPFGSFQISPI